MEHLNRDGHHKYEYWLKRKDGTPFLVRGHSVAVFDDDGQPIKYEGYIEDITERKQMEEITQISLSLQRVRNEILQMEKEDDWKSVARVLDRELRTQIEYYACGINILDTANDIRFHYGIVDGKIGYEEKSDIGPALRHILETGKSLYRRTRTEIDQWQGYSGEECGSVVDVPFPGGTLAVNSTQEHAFDERDIGILEQFAPVVAEGVRRFQDLSELASREAQLRQAQKMEAVGQLTAGIAHNFNNRLMVISTAIESLQLRETFDPVELEIAASSVEQAAKMVTQLMLFSRSEGEGEFKPIQVREIFSDVGEIGHKSFDRKIALIDEIPRDLPLISGDSTQLEQVFLNLLLNARDAVEEGNASSPSIRMVAKVVSIGEEDQPADLVSRQRDYLRIDIIDNGVGMNEETQQRVFEPFFTTKEVDKGTGLGLATVYAIVKDHQGWIECESQVGVGTAFSVYLPITEQEIGPSDDEQAKTIPRGTETILLIEDEADLRDQQVSIFKQYGYEVLVGKDGQEGWETFEREWEHVDVVLLDLSMPNLSGQEILARMLTLNPDVKVIVSTGYTQHSADAMGVQALLKKPYRITQVLQTIREVLDSNQ